MAWKILHYFRSRFKRFREERSDPVVRFFICRRCLQETRAVVGAAHLCPDCYDDIRRLGSASWAEPTLEHRARLAGLEGAPPPCQGGPRSAFAGRRP
jgi:hypothetical protein